MKMSKDEFSEFSKSVVKDIQEMQHSKIHERLKQYSDDGKNITNAGFATYAIMEAQEFTVKYVNALFQKLLFDEED